MQAVLEKTYRLRDGRNRSPVAYNFPIPSHNEIGRTAHKSWKFGAEARHSPLTPIHRRICGQLQSSEEFGGDELRQPQQIEEFTPRFRGEGIYSAG